MRASDWIMRLLIFLLIALFFYFLLFVAYPQYKSIEAQAPNRPSVSTTLDKLDNGREATLDEEDYEDSELERMGNSALSTIKDGATAAGTVVAEGATATKNAIGRGAETIGNTVEGGVDAAKDAISTTRDKAADALAGTPSIDDLVALKEEQAKAFEEQEGGQGATTNSTTSLTEYGSNPEGQYMVVAGTYRQMINAETELKKLKKLGYDNATIAKFNKSTYASLIVDRFASSSEAYKYMNTLKAKGMDVYVHRKR